ncbi:MAG TPA: helix-turn-helix domain-containing protein [Thermodesulfovibrionales bacterium]|nr:helix-turn-helix domain-containing protein [Thermodesulfovibrionales bacterium]
MSNIAKLLKETIERGARKQARAETHALRKASGQYRKIIAQLSARLKGLEREVMHLHKRLPQPPAGAGQIEAASVRFSAKGLRSTRKRLGLSAKECGLLVGVSGGTIGNWERGRSRPKGRQITALAALRRIGKRQAQKRIRELA